MLLLYPSRQTSFCFVALALVEDICYYDVKRLARGLARAASLELLNMGLNKMKQGGGGCCDEAEW